MSILTPTHCYRRTMAGEKDWKGPHLVQRFVPNTSSEAAYRSPLAFSAQLVYTCGIDGSTLRGIDEVHLVDETKDVGIWRVGAQRFEAVSEQAMEDIVVKKRR